MVKTDINAIEQWKDVDIRKLPELLKSQGFHFMKQFSTDEHRMFVSEDGQFMLHLDKTLAKVYSTKDKKVPLYSFKIVVPQLSDRVIADADA